MRIITRMLIILFFSQTLAAAQCEVDSWQASLDELSSLSASEDSKAKVLADLSEWAPGGTLSKMGIPLWLLDAYREDESFRRTVDSYSLPALTQNCYESFTGLSLACPLDAMVHATEIGIEALGVVKRMPFLLSAEYRSEMLENITWREGAKLCTAMLSHWCALTSSLSASPHGSYVGDPIGYAASLVTIELLRIAGIAFLGATAYLAMDGEFIDLALRSLKRKYETQKRYEEIAVVSMMMAHRKTRMTPGL